MHVCHAAADCKLGCDLVWKRMGENGEASVVALTVMHRELGLCVEHPDMVSGERKTCKGFEA